MKNHPRTNNRQVEKILREGTYEGSGIYSPTEKYPNGLTTKNVLVIKKINNSKYKYENRLTAYDSKTTKMKYEAIRKGEFILGTGTHQGKLTHHAQHSVDNNIVSTVSGFLSKISKDSLIFTVNAEFHISKNSFDSMKKILKRENGKLIQIFKEEKPHPTKQKPFKIVETYRLKK